MLARQQFGRASAPSPHEYREALAHMFGTPTEKLKDPNLSYSETHEQYWNAKAPTENRYLTETVTGMVKGGEEWYTRVVPFISTDQTEFKWSVIKSNGGLAGPVPLEGTSRMLTSRKETFTQRTERIGARFEMQAEMIGTVGGQNEYMFQLSKITGAVLETVIRGIMIALMNAHYIGDGSNQRKRNATMDSLKLESDNFASLALTGVFAGQVTAAKTSISNTGLTADTLIVFPGFENLTEFTSGPVTTAYHMERGPGEWAYIQGPNAIGIMGDLTIHESRQLRCDRKIMQPLESEKMVGEYYPSVLGSHRNDNGAFDISMRAIAIFDLGLDDFHMISFEEMIEHLKCFGPDGRVSDAMLRLEQKTNDRLASEWSEKIYGKYRSPESLEAGLIGSTTSARANHGFLSTNFDEHKVFFAEFLGQFDVDVATNSDFRYSAMTALRSMFGADRRTIDLAVFRLNRLIADWESSEPTKEYLKLLAEKNINRAVDQDGKLALKDVESSGSKTVQWPGNEHGGMDLPDAPVGFENKLPPMMANWAGIETYVAQAVAKKWVTDKRGEELYSRVREVRDTVVSIGKKFLEKLGGSIALTSDAVPEWFPDVPEKTSAATFELLHAARLPMFLLLPETAAKKLGTAGTNDIWAEKDKVVPTDIDTVAGGWPVFRRAANVLDAFDGLDSNNNNPSTKYLGVFDAFLKVYLDAATRKTSDKNKMQSSLTVFQTAVFKFLNGVFSADEDLNVPRAVQEFALWVDTAVALDDELKKKPAEALVALEKISADFVSKNGSWMKRIPRSKPKADKGEIMKKAEILKSAWIRTDADKAIKISASARDHLDNAFKTTSNNVQGETVISELSAASEECHAFMREHHSLVPYKIGRSFADWGSEIATKHIDSDVDWTEMERLSKNWQSARDQLSAVLNGTQKIAATPQPATKKRVYIRAPLTGSAGVIRAIGRMTGLVYAKPSDPATGYRLPVTRIEGTSLEELLGHSSLAPHMATGFAKDNHPRFEHSGLGISMQNLSRVGTRELGADSWTYGRAGTGTRAQYSEPMAPAPRQQMYSSMQIDAESRDNSRHVGVRLGAAPRFNFQPQIQPPNAANFKEQKKARKSIAISNFQKFVKGHFLHRWQTTQQEGNTLVRAAMKLCMLLPNTRVTWLNLCQSNINPPCNLVIHRTWIKIKMLSVIIMRAGADTAFTAVGKSVFTLASDSNTHMIGGNFTMFHKTVIKNNGVVRVVKDVYPNGVVSGWGCRWLEEPSKKKANTERRDMFVSFHPITENKFSQFMPIVRGVAPDLLEPGTHSPHSAADFLAMYWNITADIIERSKRRTSHHSRGAEINLIEAMGAHIVYNRANGQHNTRRDGRGHLSHSRTGKGAARVWSGNSRGAKFPDQSRLYIGNQPY